MWFQVRKSILTVSLAMITKQYTPTKKKQIIDVITKEIGIHKLKIIVLLLSRLAALSCQIITWSVVASSFLDLLYQAFDIQTPKILLTDYHLMHDICNRASCLEWTEKKMEYVKLI